MTTLMETSLAPIVPGEPRGAGRVPLRVLFADDDACILGGLADSLRRRPSGWC